MAKKNARNLLVFPDHHIVCLKWTPQIFLTWDFAWDHITKIKEW